ncbi:hypothetical protein D3C76_1371460 [compost metagenome]
MFTGANEDPSGFVRQGRLHPGGDQPHDLILQILPVTAGILIEDHQVDQQSFEAPVVVCLNELLHQPDILTVGDGQQHDWQIAGNRIAP